MRRLPAIKPLIAVLLIFSGCAHTPTYLPTFSSSKAHCDPVWTTHIPPTTANIHEVGIILRNNPSLLDKGLPSPTMLDALGKNGIPIGLGAASIVSAINGNPLASVIGSAVTAGLEASQHYGRRAGNRTGRKSACRTTPSRW